MPAHEGNGLLGEELDSTVAVYFSNLVTLYLKMALEILVVSVNCNLKLFSEDAVLVVLILYKLFR